MKRGGGGREGGERKGQRGREGGGGGERERITAVFLETTMDRVIN